MTMLTQCPKCGADDTHNITSEYYDEDGFVCAYGVHCIKCEHVWKERLR